MFRARSTHLAHLAHLFLLVALVVFWFSYTVADPDLWGHIRFGQDIIKTRSVIHDDVYSYRSEPGSWINHEWLSEAIFAAIYEHLGVPGLVGFKVIVSLVIIGLCDAHLARFGSPGLFSVFLLAVASVPFRLGLNEIRPHLFTYLLFLLVLLALERASLGRVRWLWSLPLVFAAWVNLHGGVLAGAGIVGLWVCVQALECGRARPIAPLPFLKKLLGLAALAVASVLVLLLNPYGARLIQFLLRTATVARPEISEWAPLSLFSFAGSIFLALLALGIVGLVASRRRRRPEAIFIFGTTAVLAISSNRHYPLFALSLIVFVGEHLVDSWSRWSPRAFANLDRSRIVALSGCAVGAMIFAISPSQFRCIRIEPFYFAFPARAVGLVRESGVRGNMAVPFDWGEYVVWHLGPGVKVSIDGRRETLYSDDRYRESLDFERGTRIWNAMLKNSSTDLVLAPSASATTNLLSRTPGWQGVYQDEFCTLFARAGYPEIARLVESPIPDLPTTGAGLCFPGLARAHR